MHAAWTRLSSSPRYTRGKLTLREDAWRLPGGGAQAGEDPLAAAQGELREEGGYRAERLAFLTPDPLPADHDEFLERRIVSLEEASRSRR